jgi:hypothetical protein
MGNVMVGSVGEQAMPSARLGLHRVRTVCCRQVGIQQVLGVLDVGVRPDE